jgi:hypothetical protein
VKRLVRTLRSQSIGVLALFVALGGTGYAAISIPAGSIGTRALRNGAVTTNKLAKGILGATVRAWAQITPSGTVAASSEPAQAAPWNPANAPGSGAVRFARPFPSRGCFALANIEGIGGLPALGVASATLKPVAPDPTSSPNGLVVVMSNVDGTPGSQLPVLVAVLCSR